MNQASATYDFRAALANHGFGRLRRKSAPLTLQINVGKLCNQACHHCHVDAGPKRTEIMSLSVAERLTELLASSPETTTVDLTGGAPELNPNFRFLTERARELGRAVIVRCNLTVLFEPGMEWLPAFYRKNEVTLICSLPCYSIENVEMQRGRGVFTKSIEALRRLNREGFGRGLKLDLVYNPVGPFLPPSQAELEQLYRDELRSNFAVEFDRLLTIANMPINRFAHQLEQWGKYSEYMGLLVNHFNPQTVDGLMCRSLVSAGWDGRLYDCDFNQMLEMPLRSADGQPLTVWNCGGLDKLADAEVATDRHCFGCTAGAGSSCGGSLA